MVPLFFVWGCLSSSSNRREDLASVRDRDTHCCSKERSSGVTQMCAPCLPVVGLLPCTTQAKRTSCLSVPAIGSTVTSSACACDDAASAKARFSNTLRYTSSERRRPVSKACAKRAFLLGVVSGNCACLFSLRHSRLSPFPRPHAQSRPPTSVGSSKSQTPPARESRPERPSAARDLDQIGVPWKPTASTEMR